MDKSTGKKDAIGDLDKPRLSLIPKKALWELGKAVTHGEAHYGTYNHKKGIPVTYLLDAAMRHIIQFTNGEDIDPTSNVHHLGCAMANLSFILDQEGSMVELDDRYKKNQVSPSENIQQAINEVSNWPEWKIKNTQLAFSERQKQEDSQIQDGSMVELDDRYKKEKK